MLDFLKKAMLLSHQPTFESKEQIMGLGWRVTVANKRTYLHHSGDTGGFRSFVGFEQDKQFGIVILSNATEDVTAIGEEFFKNISPPSLR